MIAIFPALRPAALSWMATRLIALACAWTLIFAAENSPEATAVNADADATWDPIGDYTARQVLGWTVLVHHDLTDQSPELATQTLELLQSQLFLVSRVVPGEALEKLRKIRIWVEVAHPRHPCMCYHVSPDWLRDHDMNPEKAECVEIANCHNFLKWTRDQPYMVLHELAHGYHHQFLPRGYDNEQVSAAWKSARDQGIYNEVQRIQGRREKAYAMTNPMEYFAELSEAYLGTNDFFPFVRSELQVHDPDGFEMVHQLWHGMTRE